MMLNVKNWKNEFLQQNFEAYCFMIVTCMEQQRKYKLKKGEFFSDDEINEGFFENEILEHSGQIEIEGRSYEKYLITGLTDKEKDPLIKERYEEYINAFNRITRKSYRGDAASARKFNASFRKFGMAKLLLAVKIAYEQDDFCREGGYLTPEFLLRDNKINKYLNMERKITSHDVFSGN